MRLCVLRLLRYATTVPNKLHHFHFPPGQQHPDSDLFLAFVTHLQPGETRRVLVGCAPYDRRRASTCRGFVKNISLPQRQWLEVHSNLVTLEKGIVWVTVTNKGSEKTSRLTLLVLYRVFSLSSQMIMRLRSPKALVELHFSVHHSAQ